MNIVFVGHWDSQWETENDWQAAFESLGHHIIPLDVRHATWQHIRTAGLAADLVLWSGGCNPTQPLAETIETFWHLTNAGVPTATLHLDTWWGLTRGGCPWWLNPMFHTGVIFTASGDHDHLWDAWGKHHVWLPPAVRHTAVEQPGEPRPEWRCDVAFVGSDGRGYHPEWPYRSDLCRHLEDMCDRNGWTYRNPGGRDPRISREHMSDFYASATVTVGDSLCPRREHSRYWSDRPIEATGRRGLVIMPHINALAALYPVMPTYPWGDFTALEATIRQLLDTPNERARIIDACHAVTAEHHTYRDRARTVLDTIWSGAIPARVAA